VVIAGLVAQWTASPGVLRIGASSGSSGGATVTTAVSNPSRAAASAA
jgi:hypothetical protein